MLHDFGAILNVFQNEYLKWKKKGKKKKHEPPDSKNDILPIQFLHP